MEWIEKLQAPGLILAAAVIWLLYRLLLERDKILSSLQTELSSQAKILSRMAAILDLMCRKTTTCKIEDEDSSK